MQKKALSFFSTFIFLFAGLAACSANNLTAVPTEPQTVQPQTTEPQTGPTVTAEQAAIVTAAPTAEGGADTPATPTLDVDALIREKLQGHHSIDRVYRAQHTREEWNATLDRMIGYGAKISEEEKQIIIDYLMSRN